MLCSFATLRTWCFVCAVSSSAHVELNTQKDQSDSLFSSRYFQHNSQFADLCKNIFTSVKMQKKKKSAVFLLSHLHKTEGQIYFIVSLSCSNNNHNKKPINSKDWRLRKEMYREGPYRHLVSKWRNYNFYLTTLKNEKNRLLDPF